MDSSGVWCVLGFEIRLRSFLFYKSSVTNCHRRASKCIQGQVENRGVCDKGSMGSRALSLNRFVGLGLEAAPRGVVVLTMVVVVVVVVAAQVVRNLSHCGHDDFHYG